VGLYHCGPQVLQISPANRYLWVRSTTQKPHIDRFVRGRNVAALLVPDTRITINFFFCFAIQICKVSEPHLTYYSAYCASPQYNTSIDIKTVGSSQTSSKWRLPF
jgi:hypothetical protein